jgi:hypothetical protein
MAPFVTLAAPKSSIPAGPSSIRESGLRPPLGLAEIPAGI